VGAGYRRASKYSLARLLPRIGLKLLAWGSVDGENQLHTASYSGRRSYSSIGKAMDDGLVEVSNSFNLTMASNEGEDYVLVER
jgi:hypothetical protein